MKYLVQCWTIGNQDRHKEYRYKFDVRTYDFMHLYKNVNTTIAELKNA